MNKYLMSGVLISGLILASPTAAIACPEQKAQCSKCEAKEKQCKISKLKKKVTPLWVNKEALGLKEGQLSKIKNIKHGAIKELIQYKADKEIVMVDLNSALKGDSIDANAVNELIDRKYAAKNKAAKTYIKAIADIQKVLSKDQRAKWNEMSKGDAKGCSKCTKDKKCAKCAAASGGKICPRTGKPLE